MATIKNRSEIRPEHVNFFRLRGEWIKNILKKDFSGTYKTAEDY